MSRDAAVAEKIRELFCAQMKARGKTGFGDRRLLYFDGGKDRHGINHAAIWPKAARIVINNGFDPAIYVCTVFWNLPHYPSYHTLTSPQTAIRYRAYVDRLPETLQQVYRSGAVAMHTQLRLADVLQGVSDDAKVAIALQKFLSSCDSRLLFYCLAIAAGRPDVAAPYHEAAISEMAIYPDAYLSAWPNGLIPQEICIAASHRRAQLDAVLRR